MLVDSHCHLDFNDFEEDFDEILERARANGVTAMLNAGNNIDELDNQLALSEKYPFIYTAVGVHPDNASEYESLTAADLLAQTHHKKVVAIGECGLDYYYDNCPRDVQIKVFREHIKAAQESGLPLIIHTREAEEDTTKPIRKSLSAANSIVLPVRRNWRISAFPLVFIFPPRA